MQVLGTPRRLVVSVEDLASGQADRTSVFKGPPADRAFDADGHLPKPPKVLRAAKGWMSSDLQMREIDGGRYAWHWLQETGWPARQVLAEALPGCDCD